MKIFIVGSGAREHAIARRLRFENPRAEIVAAPGNPGIGELSVRCLENIKAEAIDQLVVAIAEMLPDLVVVGPEAPLALGLVDRLEPLRISVVGPRQAAAQLESSKSFAKEVMDAAQVPTARAVLCRSTAELDRTLAEFGTPVVLKADGLAAGKGVVVCHSAAEVTAGKEFLLHEIKATEILVEEFLMGVEATVMAACNGTEFVLLPSAHDYKRIGDGDTGPNTGGMGSVSPSPRISEQQLAWCGTHIFTPMLKEMQRRGTPFKGFLYAGLMIDGTEADASAIRIVEFNARMGDPETQSVLTMLEGSFTEGLRWIAGLSTTPPAWKTGSGAAVSVVAAAPGYPGKVSTGDEIDGMLLALNIPGIAVYQAATKLEARRLLTAGGRVLTVSARGENIAAAMRLVYRGLDVVQFRGRQARRDIGT